MQFFFVTAPLFLSNVILALETPKTLIEYSRVQVAPAVTLDVAMAGPAGGETLLLLHGYPECSWLWRGMVDPLMAAFAPLKLRLVMPDQRGFNQSSKPAGIMSYNATLIVEDAANLIRHVQSQDALASPGGGGGKKVHVICHDWGGPIGWLLASMHPELVKSLTVLNGPVSAGASWSIPIARGLVQRVCVSWHCDCNRMLVL